ncbi:MAG: hypothetical protein GWP18_05755 [Proteobacteria bacterium]|nr:hypothetical protein [Pseudomonadota bacterium]
MWRKRFLWMLAVSGSVGIAALVVNVALGSDVAWPGGIAALLSIVAVGGLAFTGRTIGGRVAARICLGATAAFGMWWLFLLPMLIGFGGGITDENRIEIVAFVVAICLFMVVLPVSAIAVSIRKHWPGA